MRKQGLGEVKQVSPAHPLSRQQSRINPNKSDPGSGLLVTMLNALKTLVLVEKQYVDMSRMQCGTDEARVAAGSESSGSCGLGGRGRRERGKEGGREKRKGMESGSPVST